MELKRSSGILLHPTSLPSAYGIGDLGPEAMRFVDFLAGSGQSLWQVLPLNPVGYSYSPYQSYSAFAGDPLLISPERLAEERLIPASTLLRAPEFPRATVDYPAASRFKTKLLHQAYRRFKVSSDFETFCAQNAAWLDDYALFMALSEAHRGLPWNQWETALARRRPRALQKARRELAAQIGFHQFAQFHFFRQHAALKKAANARGIQIIGDLPIFVAHNSADVWAHPQLFHLDRAGAPTVVAGVPPDYFSATGQRWGNPLYRWEVMEKDNYAWWIHRLQTAFTLYDLARVDHFRGFEAYWAIPATEETAVKGRWVPGPGAPFFEALRSQLGPLPLIAEDLGVITPAVEALRDRFDLPGMKVLQFAFSDPSNSYLPHNYATTNCVVYTGTHDNNTTRGWWKSASRAERAFATQYLGRSAGLPANEISWEMIRLALASTAKLAVIPLQDVLNLGASARMNTPGTDKDNWAWRFAVGALKPAIQDRLRDMTVLYGRAAQPLPDMP